YKCLSLLTLPRPPPSTLFPYTTLFRSGLKGESRLQEPFRVQPHGFGFIPGLNLDKMNQLSDELEAAAAAGGRVPGGFPPSGRERSEEHTSELQSRGHLVCRLLLEKKNK